MRPSVDIVEAITPIKDRAVVISAVVEIDDDTITDMLRTAFILAEETPNPHAICPVNCFIKDNQRSTSAVAKELEIDAASGRTAKILVSLEDVDALICPVTGRNANNLPEDTECVVAIAATKFLI